MEPLNAAVLAIVPEQWPYSADPLARAILVTAVQVEAWPRVRMRTLPGHDVPLRQPRLVATGEFLGTVGMAGFPESDGWR